MKNDDFNEWISERKSAQLQVMIHVPSRILVMSCRCVRKFVQDPQFVICATREGWQHLSCGKILGPVTIKESVERSRNMPSLLAYRGGWQY